MKKTILIGYCLLPLLAWAADEPNHNWPQWRGPLGTGAAPSSNPPATWSETENIRWKVPIPGQGHASPIAWGDRVFVLTAIQTDQSLPQEESDSPANIYKFDIIALDRQSGNILWQRTARAEPPHEGTHQDGSWAPASPATDGERVFAHFGSRGLYCYDMEGELLWSTDLGDMATRHSFGEGASPALHGDSIVINWDHEGESFIVALDKRTGQERWRVARDERTTWGTPLIVKHADRTQVIVNATNRIRSYDLADGAPIWECSGMTVNPIPTPVTVNGVVYVMSGFRGNALLAIRLAGAEGDITDSESVVWSYDRDTPYVPSPLLYDGMLYFLKGNNGVLSGLNLATGDKHFGPQRLEGIEGIYASPVGAQDRVYITGRNGTTLVLKSGPEYEILHRNALDDRFNASPAIAGDELFLRGEQALYCIAED
ncbi:MAG: PQQ-binding-like beta-propeller repeat protein [Candidatus Latescibacterota bacterium]|jgi:outer membrane protein assembly factor BamB